MLTQVNRKKMTSTKTRAWKMPQIKITLAKSTEI